MLHLYYIGWITLLIKRARSGDNGIEISIAGIYIYLNYALLGLHKNSYIIYRGAVFNISSELMVLKGQTNMRDIQSVRFDIPMAIACQCT